MSVAPCEGEGWARELRMEKNKRGESVWAGNRGEARGKKRGTAGRATSVRRLLAADSCWLGKRERAGLKRDWTRGEGRG